MLQVATIERMKPGHLVSHYLLASYLYYQLDMSPMTDAAYDRLCARLLEAYPGVEHQHKHLIDVESLAAGSGFNIPEEDYPSMVRDAVYDYCADCLNGKILAMLEPHLLPDVNPRPRVIRRSRLRTAEPAQPAPTVRRISRSRT